MKLSFIIIAYNEEKNIINALNSIFAQADLPKSFEVIVVDDGSKDETLAMVKRYMIAHQQLKVIDLHPNQGRGAARAAGVKQAKGDFIAFIDADIILPTNWFTSCMKYMDDYDACAGTAIPDGDITWIYNTFKLTPKVVPHTTTVTGSNGLYRRGVFSKVKFNQAKTNGEDVDLGYQMAQAKLKSTRAEGLIVEHRENKNYSSSLKWLYVSGIGAMKQYYEHRQLRMPDISFFFFIFLILFDISLVVLDEFRAMAILISIILVFLFVTITSTFHLYTKFVFKGKLIKAVGAVLANDSLLLAYYLGRISGIKHILRSEL